MLEIYDKNRKKLAILPNAFNISETTRINAGGMFAFSLPDADKKNEYCQRFNLVRYNGGEYYRIMQDGFEESETGAISYECEHVVSLLIDNVIPKFVNVGGLGMYTADVINYVLSRQITQNWVLDECDFTRQFEYGWDKENLLAALFSIPNQFVDDYMWVYNTAVYPYKISLKRVDKTRNPDHYIRKGHNRISLSKSSDSRNICTRLYPYGAGEGVNQLTIAAINKGSEYLQSPQEYIEKYGLVESVWIDRRYTDIESLREAAQVMLNELQEPYLEYDVEMTGSPKVGDIVQIVGGIKSVVVETTVRYEEVPQISVKIANRPRDIASSVADLADRQRIEMTYSQGATQVYAAQGSENADSSTPFNISLYIPNEMIYINSVFAKIKISAFRAYNTNLLSGGTTQTSSNGGATTSSSGGATTSSEGGATTSSSGGGTQQSTGGGGATFTSSGSGGQTTSGASSITTTAQNALTSGSVQTEDDKTNIGKHNHGGQQSIYILCSQTAPNINWKANTTTGAITGGSYFQWVPSGAHNHGTHNHNMAHTHGLQTHTHSITLNDHTHSISIAAHTHTIGSHTHTIGSHTHTIGNHQHTIDTSHTHNITPKISFFGNPNSFALLINGAVKANFSGRDAEINLTEYLVGADGRIPRGQWITIGVRPNDIAYVEVAYNIQGFCQSRGDRAV